MSIQTAALVRVKTKSYCGQDAKILLPDLQALGAISEALDPMIGPATKRKRAAGTVAEARGLVCQFDEIGRIQVRLRSGDRGGAARQSAV